MRRPRKSSTSRESTRPPARSRWCSNTSRPTSRPRSPRPLISLQSVLGPAVTATVRCRFHRRGRPLGVQPPFAEQFGDVRGEVADAVDEYIDAVESGEFPRESHSHTEDELDDLY